MTTLRLRDATPTFERASALLRWGFPGALLVALTGYAGPWVAHRTAGLTILGVDLAEYVKFLPQVEAGTIPMWRESFLLPAAALASGLALVAVNRHLVRRWYVCCPLLLLGVLSAASMLPPAWTPALLRTPEFRTQAYLLCASLALLLLSPAFARLPVRLVIVLVASLVFVSGAGALAEFVLVTPAIGQVYGTTAALGWGLPVFALGTVAAMLLAVAALIERRPGGSDLFHVTLR